MKPIVKKATKKVATPSQARANKGSMEIAKAGKDRADAAFYSKYDKNTKDSVQARDAAKLSGKAKKFMKKK